MQDQSGPGRGVPRWISRLGTWRCYCCGAGFTPSRGASECSGRGQKARPIRRDNHPSSLGSPETDTSCSCRDKNKTSIPRVPLTSIPRVPLSYLTPCTMSALSQCQLMANPIKSLRPGALHWGTQRPKPVGPAQHGKLKGCKLIKCRGHRASRRASQRRWGHERYTAHPGAYDQCVGTRAQIFI